METWGAVACNRFLSMYDVGISSRYSGATRYARSVSAPKYTKIERAFGDPFELAMRIEPV